MNKLDMESVSIVDENIEKIGNLFPNVLIESENGKAIDFDLLKQELSKEKIVEGNKEKYQLTWPGKKEAIVTANTPTTNTLRPVREKSVDFDNTQNVYIEGDNLEALKILQESYLNKIKCIFIDPPYNTGNDFVYNDNFNKDKNSELEESGQIDEDGNKLVSNNQSNGRFHSNWLSMFYSRIKLARNLLSLDGIIFISLDDHENYNARKILNEIFGENNFICEFVWEKKKKPSFLHRNVGKIFDYILCYAKDCDSTGAFSIEKTTEGKKYPFNNAGNGMATLKFPPNSVKFLMQDGIIRVQDMSEGNIKTVLLNDLIIENGYNKNEFCLKGEWRYSQDKLNEIIGKNEEIIVSKIPFRPNHVKSGGELKKMKNFLSPLSYKCETNEDGTARIIELFGFNAFDMPKPVGLIKILLKSINLNNNDVVLDFFSGSSTTADAVMQLNVEENKHIKYIMIQFPEIVNSNNELLKNNYMCITDIGEERIRRAGKKIKEETNADIDYGFRVYKIDSSNMKDVYYKPNDLSQEQLNLFENNIKEDRTTDDLLTQVILDLGLSLDLKIEEKKILENNVYFVDNNSLVACFDDTIDVNIIDEISKCNPLKVVFKDSSFKSDNDKINLEERIKKLSPDTEISIL